MNKYQKTADDFNNFIIKELKSYLIPLNFELPFILGGINLLEDKFSAVKSSTAVGYCIEEFFSVRLTKQNPNLFNRVVGGTQGFSYDLFAMQNNIRIMINFKASLLPQDGNSGVAAMTKLHADYNMSPKTEKLYSIIKFKYKILENGNIFIDDIFSFFLEQVDFNNIGQDKRNWTDVFNANSGRITISNKILTTNLKSLSEIDYIDFKNQLNNRFKLNKEIT